MKYLLIAFIFCPLAVFAQANCGTVNGVFTCAPDWGSCATGPQGTVCAQPPTCRMAGDNYLCDIAATDPKAPQTPAAQAPDKKDAGVVSGLEWIAGYMAGDGQTSWWEGASRKVTQKLVVAYLKLKINGIKRAWAIAKGILQDFDVFQRISSALSGLPAELTSALSFFGVFTALGNILTAAVTGYVIRLFPAFF